MNTDHIVLQKNGGEFYCHNCKQSHYPKLPMPITDYVDAMNAFINLHKNCQPPEKATEQTHV